MKSTKHHVQIQLSSNQAFSQFVSSSPSHLFVFLPRSLPQLLVSSSVGQSVCSEVFISAAGLPSCRRDKQLFKILHCSPSSHIHLPPPINKPSPPFPKLLVFLPLSSAPCSSLFFLSLPPALILLQPSSTLSMLPLTTKPFSSSCAGYLGIGWIVLSRTLSCSDLIRDHSVVPVCICHLVATVPSSGAPGQTHNQRSGRPLNSSVKVSVTLRDMELTVFLTRTHTETPPLARYFYPNFEDLQLSASVCSHTSTSAMSEFFLYVIVWGLTLAFEAHHFWQTFKDQYRCSLIACQT